MTIELNNVGFTIGKRPLFEAITQSVPDGAIWALQGSSGSGKTTLLNIMGLLLKPTEGEVTIDGRPTRSWNDRQRRHFWHDYAAFIYQDYGIIPSETVAYNITLMSRFADCRRIRPQASSQLHHIAQQVGLDGMLNERAGVLSGGEKQRVGIARALWKNASYIFADEPTASLDASNRDLVMELLLQRTQSGSTVIVASHDADFIRHCDGIIDVEHYTADERRFAELRQAAKQADDFFSSPYHSSSPQ